jgi:hypothetical protein
LVCEKDQAFNVVCRLTRSYPEKPFFQEAATGQCQLRSQITGKKPSPATKRRKRPTLNVQHPMLNAEGFSEFEIRRSALGVQRFLSAVC